MKHFLTVDQFSKVAPQMRQTFEQKFDAKNAGGNDRFVWDFWYVPDQYRMVRTPAYHYFPQRTYRAFHESLVQWGRENLGCHDVSPPWLSYYVEGCRQNLHADVPHGPWAFVFSLSPKKPLYRGGETLILKPETLDYWSNFQESTDHEFSSFADRVPSKFNRLTVFDPRLPHGVTEVRGVEDPREGRLVIHGWFVEPRPYVVGALTTSQVQKSLNQALEILGRRMAEFGNLHGTVSFRLKVAPSGRVSQFKWLTDTLIGLDTGILQKRQMIQFLRALFVGLEFTKRSGSSQITIPLLFK